MAAWIDLTGQKFGKLTCMEHLGGRKWKVQCDCGTITVADRKHMKNGTKSCGCLIRETARKNGRIAGELKHADYANYALKITGESDLRTAVIKTLNKCSTQHEAAHVLLIADSTLRLWKRRMNIKRLGKGRYA